MKNDWEIYREKSRKRKYKLKENKIEKERWDVS